ncbi:MAG: hypothetical protein SFZ02_00355 [bacterium]|nr:hypothetical protein [bacterium]
MMKISRYILAVMLNLGLLAFAIIPSFADVKPEQVTSKISLNTVNAAPNPPILIAPENYTSYADPIFEFIWGEVDGAINYQIQITRDWTFATILHTNTISTPTYTYTAPNANGYYWRVRAILPSAQTDWSEEWVVGYVLYDSPVLILPIDGIAQTSDTVVFTWEAVPGADRYYVQVGLAPDGNSSVYSNTAFTNTLTQYNIAAGVYYWRVVAIGPDIPGQYNGGIYSEFWQFTVTSSHTFDVWELSFYYAFPNYATADMSVVMADITSEGIFLTIQFADNSIATVLMVFQVGNRLMNIQLQELTWLVGGSPDKVILIYEQIPTMFLQAFSEILPTNYLWIEELDFKYDRVTVYYEYVPLVW